MPSPPLNQKLLQLYRNRKRLYNNIVSSIKLKECRTWKDVKDHYNLNPPPGITDLSLKADWKLLEKILDERLKDYEKELINPNYKKEIKSPAESCKIFTNIPPTRQLLATNEEKPAALDLTPPNILEPLEPAEEVAIDLLPDSPFEGSWQLFTDQIKAANDIWFKLFKEKDPLTGKHGLSSTLLQAGVGVGKTFIYGRVLRALEDINYIDNNQCFSPFPILIVTKASIVEQTKRVMRDVFKLDVLNRVIVTNYDQLRATLGELMLRTKTIVEGGVEHIVFEWKKNVHPIVVIWDECQSAKNEGSQQSLIVQAFQNLLDNCPHIKQIWSSATPFMNVAEAKAFSLSTRIPYIEFAGYKEPLRAKDWSSFSKQIAAPSSPYDFVEAAMERYVDKFALWITRVKNSKWQFKAKNGVKVITFKTREEREFYNFAWEKYVERLAKIDREAPDGFFKILAEFTIFRKAAEWCRIPQMAAEAHQLVTEGFAYCGAFNFKQSIARFVKLLVKDYGWKRKDISLIWGGDAVAAKKLLTIEQANELTDKLRLGQVLSNGQMKALEEYIIHRDDSDQDRAEYVEMKNIYSELDLGIQSKKERQEQIDRFQRGDSVFCLFTFKAGGVGLSLHHTDELTKQKVRHKKSGFCVVEDIPSIPTRQRITRLGPTFSAIEMVQGLGRVPRRTSLSDTEQVIVFYKGTFEEHTAVICTKKLKCLKVVVQQRESWQDAAYDAAKHRLKTTNEQVDESFVETDEQFGGSDLDEEEE